MTEETGQLWNKARSNGTLVTGNCFGNIHAMNIHDAMISKQSACAMRGVGSRVVAASALSRQRLLSPNLIAAVCTFPHVHPTASRSFSSRFFLSRIDPSHPVRCGLCVLRFRDRA